LADQLDPIPERIANMAAPDIGDTLVFLDFDARSAQVRNQRIVVRTPQARVRPLRRAKIGFNSQMQVHASAPKPASTSFDQLLWLREFGPAEQRAIESPSPIFLARRHRKLHLIDGGERIVIHGIILFAHTDSTIPTKSAGPEI
jgi:hypothetical protein